jgi:hypothetical protein
MSTTPVDAQTTEPGAQPVRGATPAEPIGAVRFAALSALVALSDWLFFRHHLGVSIALFVIALALGSVLANSMRGTRGAVAFATGILVLACVPLLLMPTMLSVILALAAAAYFAVALAAETQTQRDKIFGAASLLLDCGWRVLVDLFERPWLRSQGNVSGAVLPWIVPLAFGSVFVWLFAQANPVIESWLTAANPTGLLAHIETGRIVFWLVAAVLVWPFVCVRIRPKVAATPPLWPKQEQATSPLLSPHLFGKPALLRSLILFNALFAVQTVLDVAYLWGGVELPEGMTYAAYAHRGAYPLIITALLAAAFVIAVMQPKTEAERSALLRWLVYLWVAQNVLLVLSSLLRLDLYVEVYSLTYWRIAALLWMVLVAIGLSLIVVRIAMKRSNAWLINANLVVLTATIYACGFVNFPGLIANFNVAHSREVSGGGSALDVGYLRRLGPQTIPALDRFIMDPSVSISNAAHATAVRIKLASRFARTLNDWRAWTYRDRQLAQYLDANPTPRLSDKLPSSLPASE